MKRLYGFIMPAVAALLAVAAFAPGCGPTVEPDNGTDTTSTTVKDRDLVAKMFLRQEYMNIYYYWYKDVFVANSRLNVEDYDIYTFFDKMLYSRDRWSWMCDSEYYLNSESGVVSGTYGASLSQAYEYHEDYDVKVRYVYPGSPFAEKGVTRGWTLTHIDGKATMDLIRTDTFSSEYAKSPQTFTFRDVAGAEHTFTATASQSLSTKSSLITRVFTAEDFPGLTEPVGYFLYMSFKVNFLNDISEAMETFRAAGVKTVILDLRYNGGGDSRASQLIIDYLAPESQTGKVYVHRVHNDLLSEMDERSLVRPRNEKGEYVGVHDPVTGKYIKAAPIGAERIYVITGDGTASASEMIANGLRPMMDVKMVGDTTYGKPNGMYVLMYPGSSEDYKMYNNNDYSRLKWVFLPICFYNNNGAGEAIPDRGFVPDNYRPDDLYHDFGVEEDNIKACLTDIVTGTWPALPGKHGYTTRSSSKKRINLTEESTNPAYGLYTVMPEF